MHSTPIAAAGSHSSISNLGRLVTAIWIGPLLGSDPQQTVETTTLSSEHILSLEKIVHTYLSPAVVVALFCPWVG